MAVECFHKASLVHDDIEDQDEQRYGRETVHAEHGVAIALNAGAVRPVSDRAGDVDAARRIDGLLNRLFFDPVVRGRYPADVLADMAATAYEVPLRDFERFRKQHPHAGERIMRNLAQLLADRLILANAKVNLLTPS